MVMSFQAGAHSGKYLQMGSWTLRLPRSCSRRIPMAVNCLLIEPKRNFVFGVFGTLSSRLADPYPLLTIALPSRASKTAPLNCLILPAALRYSSALEAISCELLV